jgi:hypothetical protein
MKRLLLGLILVALVVGVPAYAHHSFAAHYFEDQIVSIEGELTQFEYRSPHAWVHVRVKDANGVVQQFSAEWSNPNRLKGLNITATTLKPGDFLIVTGSPGRRGGERKLHLKGIERPADGWRWGRARARRVE